MREPPPRFSPLSLTTRSTSAAESTFSETSGTSTGAMANLAAGAGLPILVAMNQLHKPMYEGTVPSHIVEKRRAKNRRARQSRRKNR